MAINQNIQKFYQVAQGQDFSRDFLFRVIQLNLAGIDSFTDEELVYVRAAELPGRNIENVQAPYMGLPFNVPGSAKYPGSDAYTLEFYLPKNGRLRTKFEVASRFLFDDVTSSGNYGTPNNNYLIQLAQLDKNLEPIPNGIYTLYGASIRNINPIQYTIAEGRGDVVKITCTISYHFYDVESFSVPGIDLTPTLNP
jgi:hypothetical protein